MDLPFRVTERMTLSSVSSRYTTSNKRTEKKKGKGAESEETKNQVNDVVDNLRVGADLSDAPLECFCVAHDAQQMNALQHNRAVAVSRSINVGWGPAEQISRNMTVMIGNVMATAADRSITAQIRPKWDNNERSFNIRWDFSWHELDTNLRDEFQDQERVHQCRMGRRRRQSSW